MSSPIQSSIVREAFAERYLGKPVYRLARIELAAEALQSLAGVGSFLIEAKVPTEAVGTTAMLTALGFKVIDTGVQLDVAAAAIRRSAEPILVAGVAIRDAAPGDRREVERVAVNNLVTSRFHLDPQIDPAGASRLKQAWAGNYFEGQRGERLLIAERDGVVGGFLLVLERGDVGTIDLIALDPWLRGSGAFPGLVRAWLDRAPGIARVVVGTQISNVRSLKAYGRMGFRVCGAAYMLHYHGDARGLRAEMA